MGSTRAREALSGLGRGRGAGGGATSAAATWAASELRGHMGRGLFPAVLGWALLLHDRALTCEMWFKVVMLTAFCIACLVGLRYGKRRPSPA